ncbi:Cyclic nucleotide-binding domain-containing protein [Verrucomicrobium sp. GAS474]|uniref:cyclic nucleotide-binding domain-containing protein n=1 Tax=Verrucomicrobium sp. GAS474 TaxID=1882831 RepID=UPI00087A6AB1|nr:cyclic nucleotide-binding domain-containing protein [Verrucomicrobium sp. GAS474]SDU19629.1 Cyclic nucleotide-binding domain-containing protein [Verrucomicrobium sp. GAS474]
MEVGKGDGVVLKAGEILFREGDPWDGLYLIKSGTAEVFRERSGQTIRLSTLGAREFIGTVTIFTREPRTAGVRALTDLSLQFFNAEFVHQNFGFNNPAISGLLKDVVSRLKDINLRFTDTVLELGSTRPVWHTVLRHARQLAYFLILRIRAAGILHEGRTCVPTEGLAATQNHLFYFSETYGSALLRLLVTSGLLTVAEVPGYGPCLIDPSIPKLQSFLDFTKHVETLEVITLSSTETDLLPVIELLEELMVSPDFGPVFPLDKLLPLVVPLRRTATPMETFSALATHRFLALVDGGQVRLDCPRILQYVHFNTLLAEACAMEPELEEV